MTEVTAYVAAHPGCPKIKPAWRVSPRHENQVHLRFGYQSVDRAMDAGLIDGVRLPRRWSLTVTDKGRQLLKGE